MRKLWCIILSIALIVPAFSAYVIADDNTKTDTISYNYSYDFENGYNRSDRNTRQMEKLNRGLVAIKTDSGVILSWRLLDSEDNIYGSAEKNVSFNIYRDNMKIDSVSKATFYTDTAIGTSYSVAPVIDSVEGEKCKPVSVMNNSYFDIPLEKPAPETVYDIDENVHNTYSFFPADCSTGDLDGDGEYEIVVKWTSSERDVGSPGDAPVYSGTVRFAAYKLNGTKLWDNDINLGKNVFSSAHTVQFLVYDFDGDGKAEMTCQTSLGSTDASGRYVTNAAKLNSDIYAITDDENANTDYRSGWVINTGREFMTVFEGKTGRAIDTIDLPTSRGSEGGSDYGDTSGNRSNRFVADVAYLDGQKPYAVYMRGYYFSRNGIQQRTSIAGISFDGERLSPDYRFDTKTNEEGYYKGAELYVGQGNHNCTVADVDNDGKDEFITGALCMEVDDNNEFKPRWCTFMEHGDALHIGDYDPTHKGLEFFTVHEDGNAISQYDTDEQKQAKIAGPDGIIGTDDDYGYVQKNAQAAGKYVICNFGMSVIDADTGEIMFHKGNTKDTGRGVMANTGSGGYYQITGIGSYQCNGNNEFTSTRNGAGSNFRIFWDGDLYDELLDGTNITNYNGNGFNASRYDCVKINGTKSNPALQADLFGDWREELVYPTTDGNTLRVFTTTEPTDYKIKTLMHDPVYRSGVAAEQTAYNQPPHVGFYMGEEVFKPQVTNIKVDVLNNIFALGENFDKSKIRVTAIYSDDTSEELENYAISGFDSSIKGEQQVTISYLGKSCSFVAKIQSASISDINGIYSTDLTELSRQKIPITDSEGYRGAFVIEHTFTLDTFPKDGTYDKKDESGFFFRFQPNSGVGGGWSIRKSDDTSYELFWKSASAMAVPSNDSQTTILNLGETYRFKYIITKVATGEGALVHLIISDMNGNIITDKSALPLRNMTNDVQKTNPLKYIEITNQASAEGSPASFKIENAVFYGYSSINSINGNSVSITLNNFSNSSVFAAKYGENGELVQLTKYNYTSDGDFIWDIPFEPDKVFMWTDNMIPIDFKTK